MPNCSSRLGCLDHRCPRYVYGPRKLSKTAALPPDSVVAHSKRQQGYSLRSKYRGDLRLARAFGRPASYLPMLRPHPNGPVRYRGCRDREKYAEYQHGFLPAVFSGVQEEKGTEALLPQIVTGTKAHQLERSLSQASHCYLFQVTFP